MQNVRLVARLDVKGTNLVKGVYLEWLLKIGDPNAFARRYYEAGIDEILYIDIVASLYERNNLLDIVERTTAEVFIPIIVGGGIRSVEDARRVLRSGGDKVAINTAALRRPELIREIARTFGSQCVVVSIQAKQCGDGAWECYYDNGREHSGRDVCDWAQQACDLGAGEILLTSVDREGTGRGFDVSLVRRVAPAVPIPVIAGGGMGTNDDLEAVVTEGAADAVAMAQVLHYDKLSVPEIREEALARGIHVRRCGPAPFELA